MKRKISVYLVGIVFVFLCSLISLPGTYANGGRSERGHGEHDRGRDEHKRHSTSYPHYYRSHRHYPDSFFFYRRFYYYPRRRYYYFYDYYPEKRYYYESERSIYPSNPEYLSITSIANMGSQGVPEAVIIEEIKRTGSVYKLTSEIITYLKHNNVSDAVIDVMLETSKK